MHVDEDSAACARFVDLDDVYRRRPVEAGDLGCAHAPLPEPAHVEDR
jgi:hypothetical protein